MKIILTSVGTQGDIESFLAIGFIQPYLQDKLNGGCIYIGDYTRQQLKANRIKTINWIENIMSDTLLSR